MNKLNAFVIILAVVIFTVPALYAQQVQDESMVQGSALIESIAGDVRIIKADS